MTWHLLWYPDSVSYYGIKNASIKIRAKHDEFPYQKFEMFSMFMPLLKEQLAQNSQSDVAGVGARRLAAETGREGDTERGSWFGVRVLRQARTVSAT